MKKRVAIPILSLLILIGGYLFVTNGGMMLVGFALWGYKMWQGQRYLHSLAEDENAKKVWVTEAKALLEIDSLKTKCIGAVKEASPLFLSKYKRLGIIRIDVCQDGVNFMWMGGMDHTGLYIKREKDSTFSITAGYNDYQGQKIYPVVLEPWDDLKKSRR